MLIGGTKSDEWDWTRNRKKKDCVWNRKDRKWAKNVKTCHGKTFGNAKGKSNYHERWSVWNCNSWTVSVELGIVDLHNDNVILAVVQ